MMPARPARLVPYAALLCFRPDPSTHQHTHYHAATTIALPPRPQGCGLTETPCLRPPSPTNLTHSRAPSRTATALPPRPQGYGLTETCAASFVTLPWDSKQIGTVGPPMPGIQVRPAVPSDLIPRFYCPLGCIGRTPHTAFPWSTGLRPRAAQLRSAKLQGALSLVRPSDPNPHGAGADATTCYIPLRPRAPRSSGWRRCQSWGTPPITRRRRGRSASGAPRSSGARGRVARRSSLPQARSRLGGSVSLSRGGGACC